MAKKKSASEALDKGTTDSVKKATDSAKNKGSKKTDDQAAQSDGALLLPEEKKNSAGKKGSGKRSNKATNDTKDTAAHKEEATKKPKKKTADTVSESKAEKTTAKPEQNSEITTEEAKKTTKKAEQKPTKAKKTSEAEKTLAEAEKTTKRADKPKAKRTEKKSEKSEPTVDKEKEGDGTLFASVPESDEIFKLTTIDDIDDTAAMNIEAAAIAALPRTEVDPELLIDETGFEDTHESAEESAKYEAYLADYKEIMAKMLRDAKSDEAREARAAAHTQEDDDISKFIVTDDFFEDEDELYEEEEYITPEEIGLTEEDLKKYEGEPTLAEDEPVPSQQTEDEADEDYDGFDVSIEATTLTASDTDTNLSEDGEGDALSECVTEADGFDSAEEADSEQADGEKNEEYANTDKDGSVGADLQDGEQILAEDGEDADSEKAFPDISLREYIPGYSDQLVPEEPSDIDEEQEDGKEEEDVEDDELTEDDYDGLDQLEMSFDGDAEEEYEDEQEEAYSPEKPRFIDKVFELVELIAFTFAAIMIVTSFFLRHSVVDGRSMQNTLSDSDVVIISDFLYTPKRGDIVVFEDYSVSNVPLIKRIIGIEGDTVEIKADGTVYVNGVALVEDYVHLSYGWTPQEAVYEIKAGQVFVLGDHRNLSMDSEDFGPINAESIIGKVLFRLFPFDSFGTVE